MHPASTKKACDPFVQQVDALLRKETKSEYQIRQRLRLHIHCLWEEPDPARYRHQLGDFVQKLRNCKTPVSFPVSLLDATETIANHAEPFLKKLYRYHAKDPSLAKTRLDRMRLLMRLRSQLQSGFEGGSSSEIAQLDRLLDISQSSERSAKLDAHIVKVLKSEAKIPLLETVKVAEDWLRLYEKLLLHTAGKLI
ncbi:MAG: hypothetical protein LLG04_18750 [Parachlamydia sp.]|nr:hypothetical protein [Parachlamydia sp.]